jgi:hypothetical protein
MKGCRGTVKLCARKSEEFRVLQTPSDTIKIKYNQLTPTLKYNIFQKIYTYILSKTSTLRGRGRSTNLRRVKRSNSSFNEGEKILTLTTNY